MDLDRDFVTVTVCVCVCVCVYMCVYMYIHTYIYTSMVALRNAPGQDKNISASSLHSCTSSPSCTDSYTLHQSSSFLCTMAHSCVASTLCSQHHPLVSTHAHTHAHTHTHAHRQTDKRGMRKSGDLKTDTKICNFGC